jgi:hypothetical protein
VARNKGGGGAFPLHSMLVEWNCRSLRSGRDDKGEGGECDIMISIYGGPAWLSLLFATSKNRSRRGCSGALRGMDGVWRKRCVIFSAML